MSASEVAIPHATSARAATEPDESESPSASPAPDADRPLSGTEGKFQGSWQAYDFSSDTKSWTMQFDGRSFRAQGGTDEWYEGRILIRDDEKPAQIDFAIDDCRCSFKGMTSKAIFQWDGKSIVIAAPRPGKSRPPRFNETSGQMLRLLRLDGRSR